MFRMPVVWYAVATSPQGIVIAVRVPRSGPKSIARVHQRGRSPLDAEEYYVDAVELQPENPETWYFLGLYEYNLGRMCAAWTFLNSAYTLDPAGRQWSEGGPLDVALEAVNRGACERS